MYIINGIAYAGEPADIIKVQSVKTLPDYCLLLKFSTGEKRIFDAYGLLQYPVYKPLINKEIFNNAYIEGGTVAWNNGDIDIAPETLYYESFKYEEPCIS
jgi:hypothetical protein